MLEPLRHLFARLRIPSEEERERAYLEAATDRFDLEYRQRQIDRGLFRPAPLSFAGLPVSR